MSRRRRSPLSANSAAQDPGKDLFAYLFILVMVFAFMLLLTLQEVRGQLDARGAPQQQSPGQSAFSQLAAGQLGHLVRNGQGLALEFAGVRYDPLRDLERLGRDGLLSEAPGADGLPVKTIYLEEQAGTRVLLTEYLAAFEQLSRAGINVAFAERVK